MRHFLTLCFQVSAIILFGQSSDFQTHHLGYSIADRWQTRAGNQAFTAVKPYKRTSALEIVNQESWTLSPADQFNQQYIRIENWESGHDSIARSSKPILRNFYAYKPDFLAHKEKNFDFHLNPIWEFSGGYDTQAGRTLFTNSRGIEFRGTIDRRISFYSTFTENQAELASYIKHVADTVGLIPYEGFWKEYNETKTDFFRSMGHVNFRMSRHVDVQLGYGRHFIGYGIRSLFLSDFSNSYPYVRNTMEVWKIKYTKIAAKLVADVGIYAGGTLGASDYPNKYMNIHYFDISISPSLNVGIFESVIYGKPDSLGGSSPKLEYFIPRLFLRGIEQQDGSGDNSVLGIEARWNVLKRGQLYGQFLLDDFSMSEAQKRDQWWGNKFGSQIGIKVFDVGISNLDLQMEWNRARPFLYAHQDIYTSYTHYRQPLAHPLGANFNEFLAVVSYQPVPRIRGELTLLSAQYGNDPEDGFSYGRDPLKSYNLRNGEYGHTLGQGDAVDLLLVQFNLSYQLVHNLFIDLNVLYRDESTSDAASIFNVGFRWNSSRRSYIF